MEQIITYIGIFLTAIISAAGSAAFVWAKSMANRAVEHDKAVDAALVIILRKQLIEDHDDLMSDGWAGHTRRQRWKEAYEAYEMLCRISGTPNGVMDDYLADIRELPKSEEEMHERVRQELV